MNTYYLYNDAGYYLGKITASNDTEAKRLADARYRGLWATIHNVTQYCAR